MTQSSNTSASRPTQRSQNGPVIVFIGGSAGSGKTTLLEETLRRIRQDLRIGVIVGNRKAERDVAKLRPLAVYVDEIRSPMPDASQVRQRIAHADAEHLDLLFVESVVRLAGSTLRERAHVAVYSVAGGDDKVAEFPQHLKNADIILLNKVDLLPHVVFDREVFHADARLINPSVRILEVSAVRGDGFDHWLQWLTAITSLRQSKYLEHLIRPSESFLG